MTHARSAAFHLLLLLAVLLLATGAQAAVAKADIPLGPSCVTTECHGDISKAQFLHGPVNLTQCEPCHIPQDNKHVFGEVAKGRDLCLTCHTVEKAKAVVHKPFESDCTVCHNPHGGDNRHFMRGGDGAGACNTCHDSVGAGMKHQHGPVAVGECLACHSPHQSDNAKLLVSDRRTLCLGCHIDVEVSMKEAISVHKPAGESCEGCHNAHGGDAQYFLVADGSDLCLKCHGDFITKSKTAAFPHAPMTEGKGCRNCHSPHASSQSKLLSTKTGDLCLSCHNKEIERANGSKLDNVSEQITKAAFQHGPVREKNCAACHQAHGSDNPSILKRAFPRDFYAPYKEGAYDLCFECHDRTLVLAADSEATGFRNGKQNLHFLHVNREKGRTCRACHAEHASDQAHHVRKEVPFGRWAMQVEFTKTDTGGGCQTGCHVPYKYDRVAPVTQTVPTPKTAKPPAPAAAAPAAPAQPAAAAKETKAP